MPFPSSVAIAFIFPAIMALPTAAYEKSNFQWQLQQLRRQLGEWIELQFFNLVPPALDQLSPFAIAPWVYETVFWVAVILLTTWLGWQGFRLIAPYFRGGQSADRRVTAQSPSLGSNCSLAAWLQLAQDNQRQGNYREACRALYQAMLQWLHDTQQVPHQLSRTDGEYRKLVQGLSKSRPCLFLIATHEQLCFGNQPISPETFDQCQRAYQELVRQ